jgi:anti-sigma factor RsiW
MNSGLCDQLDDYLARDLAVDQERAFEVHLLDCPTCHAAVRQQERMDALLAEAVGKLVPVPAGLIQRTQVRLKKVRRRRYLAYALSASAAAAVIWASAYVWPKVAEPRHSEGQPQVQVAVEKKEPPAKSKSHLRTSRSFSSSPRRPIRPMSPLFGYSATSGRRPWRVPATPVLSKGITSDY